MQTNAFGLLDGIRIAAEMEKRGGEFYRLAARVCVGETCELLTTLAEDESVHLREFQRLYTREEQRVDAIACSGETGALLAAMAADIVFPDGVTGLARNLDDPKSILNAAIRSEQDSIRFYREMTRATDDPQAVCVFEDIIRQERSHLKRLLMMLAEKAERTN